MEHLFKERLLKLIFVLIAYGLFVEFMTQYSPKFALLWILGFIPIIIFMLKYWGCPKCDWPPLEDKDGRYSGFNDQCANCGTSFLRSTRDDSSKSK